MSKSSKNNKVKHVNTANRYRKIKMEENPSVSLAKVFKRVEEQKIRK